MKVNCANCGNVYLVDAEKVPSEGARAKCPGCGNDIFIQGSAGGRAGSPLLPKSSHPDYGRTIAYDFQAVDQSVTDASNLLRQVSENAPRLGEGKSYRLVDMASGQVFAINRAEVVVGRSGAEVNLTDPEVSRRHCLLKIYGGYALLSDLESTNGTYFEGRKVMTAKVPVGGVFSVGNTTLKLLAEPVS